MTKKLSEREELRIRLKKAHKSSDDEIREQMQKLVLKVSENSKRHKSLGKTTTFQRLWAEHAALEHISDNFREDVTLEDALRFYDDAMKNISNLLREKRASTSSMNVLSKL